MSELIVANSRQRTMFGKFWQNIDELTDQEIKRSKLSKPESATLFDKKIEITPEKLKLNRYIIGHVTNAKSLPKKAHMRHDVNLLII